MHSILVGEFTINRFDKRHIYHENNSLRVYIGNTTILATDVPCNTFANLNELRDAYSSSGFVLSGIRFDKHGLRTVGFT